MMLVKLIALLGFLCLCKCDEGKSAKDSYLTAYAQSKILNEKSDSIEYFPDGPGFPGNGYPSGNGYPEPVYEKPYYGPPKPVYGPPHFHPAPNYPPPPPPPHQPWALPDQFLPHVLLGILDKIKYKLDLLTIGKIILKLVIFKKIVLFIGVLCLLLFIPSLKKKHIFLGGNNHDDDMFRSLQSTNPADDRIQNLSSFVMDSIEKFSTSNNKSVNCKSMFCKTQRLSKYIDSKMSYEKLINLYSNELS